MNLLAVALALAAGAVGGWVWGRRGRSSGRGGRASSSESAARGQMEFVLDLVRRMHGAATACLVAADSDAVLAVGETRQPGDLAERSLAAARLAMADRRQHEIQQPYALMAVGDGERGIALGWAGPTPEPVGPERVQAAGRDLRMMLAWAEAWPRPARWGGSSPPPVPWVGGGLEQAAHELCRLASEVAKHPAAVVLRASGTQVASIVAVAGGADRRLLRTPVAPESVAGRACTGDVPIVGLSGKELFGQLRADRRRRDEQGIAYPLRDGNQGVGALVVFARPDQLTEEAQQQLFRLAEERGPLLAAASSVKEAQARAETDELTGLPNRRALERAMLGEGHPRGAFLLFDLDHFKTVNDSFGHAAGDAVLRHVARILEGTLREQDVGARIGGEEFGVWLPGASLEEGRQVAERIRRRIAESKLFWAGADLAISCSAGVAGIPETVSHGANLFAAADTALYRAKEGGRNRVAVALPGS
jgi:diguanylate cyclase (GGDEF)-like protein